MAGFEGRSGGIQNIFQNICQESWLLKVEFKESARAVEFQGVFSTDVIKTTIEGYLKEFVCCKSCFEESGKLCPDTHLVKQGKTVFLECEACGSKYEVKSLK